MSSNGNGQHRPVLTTTTTRAVAALAVRAVTRNDTHAREAIERHYPDQFDVDQLLMTVEIVTQVIAEMLNLRTVRRVYCEEPK